MPLAIYISPDDTRHEVDLPVGTSLMQAAGAHGIDGIIGDCGGNLSCATCHVYVDDEFLSKLPAPTPAEDQMLEYTAAGKQANSRLSCQLVMTEALAGLTVRVADPQL